jgi:hypothetical protein
MITPANWKKYVKGALGDSLSVVNDHLETHETIFDQDLMADLESGEKREVSIGFRTDVDYTPGEFNGKRYDARQTNIRINHVAHVKAGRGGDTVRAHLDAGSGLDVAVMQDTSNKGARQMHKKKDTRLDAGDDLEANAIMEALKRFVTFIMKGPEKEPDKQPGEPAPGGEGNTPPADPSVPVSPVDDKKKDQAVIADLVSENKQLKARLDSLQAVIDKNTQNVKRKDDASRIDKAIEERLSLIGVARSVIQDFKHDGLSNRVIKLATIAQVLPFSDSVKTDELEEVIYRRQV